jgi:TIR domain
VTAQVRRGARRSTDPDVFISHLSEDGDTARRMSRDLSVLGIDAWLDKWELEPGDSLDSKIEDAIRDSRFFLVLVSAASGDPTRWMRSELAKAMFFEQQSDKRKVLPVVLKPESLPVTLAGRFYIDLSASYVEGLFRVAAFIHGCAPGDIDWVLSDSRPGPATVAECVEELRYLGVGVFSLLDARDFARLVDEGFLSLSRDDRAWFNLSPKLIVQACTNRGIKLSPLTIDVLTTCRDD